MSLSNQYVSRQILESAVRAKMSILSSLNTNISYYDQGNLPGIEGSTLSNYSDTQLKSVDTFLFEKISILSNCKSSGLIT